MGSESDPLSLGNAVRESSFSSSIITTYNAYLPFYEEVILRRLMAAGCTHNIVMMDARQCTACFASSSTRPRRAGTDYTLIPVRRDGAFHPKLLLRLGRRKGSLFVGSHNLTAAGFGFNEELTNRFEYGPTSATSVIGHFAAAVEILRNFARDSHPRVVEAVEAALSSATWLRKTHPVEADTHVLAGDTDLPALWEKIRDLVPGRVRRAVVMAPFFDAKLEFVRRLVEDLRPERVVVALDPDFAVIRRAATSVIPHARFVNARALVQTQGRRPEHAPIVHGKALWLQTDKDELLVTGSANASAPAMLGSSRTRNAEVVVVRRARGHTMGNALRLASLLDAPELASDEWARIEERVRVSPRTDPPDIPSGLAILEGGVLTIDATLDPRRPAALYDIDLDELPPAAVTIEGGRSRLTARPEVLERAAFVRALRAGREAWFIVHRVTQIANGYASDRRRALRQALGALEEDPRQLETLLALSEKVIFDKDLTVTPALLPRAKAAGSDDAPDRGPDSLAIDVTGRRATAARKLIATGDITVLLDAIIRRLGEGLEDGRGASPISNEEEAIGADQETDELPERPADLHDLARACRSKVTKMLNRLGKQLGREADGGDASRAVVQVAAVLGLVRALRVIELRDEWRRVGESLVDPDRLAHFLWDHVPVLAVGDDAILPRAVAENEGPFEELSLAIGLLVWLGWECAIELRADPMADETADEREERWRWVQCVGYVAPWFAGDDEAERIARDSVHSTPRRDVDPDRWLAATLPFLQQLGSAMIAPDDAEPNRDAPRVGDIVVLPDEFAPTVRLVVAVNASSHGPQLVVLDEEREDGRRTFLESRVRRVRAHGASTEAKIA